jgi:putative aminopeptidase FrvX
MKKKAFELLEKLCQAHGASGSEDGVRRIFREELSADLRTDRSGNVIHERRGTSDRPRIMVSGHMDEVGFVVQSITKGGLIKFLALGGWWPHVLLAQRVRIKTRSNAEILGVIGAKPPHLLTEAEREKLLKIDDMYIDVGAKDAGEVASSFGIAPGDAIVPESPFTPLHNPDLLLCKAFDNRAGMAVTIQSALMLRGASHPNTVYAVGTVQEEVGIRGAQTAAFSVHPDVAIVVEGTPADDLPSVSQEERQGALGHGVQIRLLDPSAIMNRPFVEHVVQTANQFGIPHQIAVRRSGGTDAKAIHLHGQGVPTVVLGVPARYIHTHSSIIDINDYLATLQLVLKVIESLDQATVNRFTAFP